MSTTGRNEPCPCGSGLKFKRCCLASEKAVVPPTKEERGLVLKLLYKLSHELLTDDRKLALDEFWQGIPSTSVVDEELRRTADLTFDGWYWYDRVTANGQTPAEMLLARKLPDGPHAYLERLAGTVMELWEVLDSQPGVSMKLRSAANRREVDVFAPHASHALAPGAMLAARINPLGTSGKPEIDLGCVTIDVSIPSTNGCGSTPRASM